MLLGVIFTRCVNCGGAGTSWPTILALVFAGVAATAAARSLWLQGREQKRLAEELARRADFELTVRPTGPGTTEIGLDTARQTARHQQHTLYFEIGIQNTGDRAAHHTVVNVLVPKQHSNLAWSLPNGAEHGDTTVLETSERLT